MTDSYLADNMPQLASAMSIPLSCPLYLDLGVGLGSETNFKSKFEASDNSKGMLDMSFLYENLLKSQPNMYQFNPNLLAESFNYYINQSCRHADKSLNLKSFSIESILGSTSSKDIFCNQFSLSELSGKKDSYAATRPSELANPNVSYRPGPHHQVDGSKAKDQMAANKTTNLAIASSGCKKTEKTTPSLKHYTGLSRKSSKMLKSSCKVVSSESKSKRVRTIFTPEQLERLETEFERQQYMVGSGRHYLAATLNLTEAQVKVWFQNRRIKWRKQHLEGQQDKCTKAENDLL